MAPKMGKIWEKKPHMFREIEYLTQNGQIKSGYFKFLLQNIENWTQIAQHLMEYCDAQGIA